MNVRGRELTLTPYYPCPYCDPNGSAPLIQVGGVDTEGQPHLGGLLTLDGALTRAEYRYETRPWDSKDTVPTREVGRRPCRHDGLGRVDHVFYDWRWAEDS